MVDRVRGDCRAAKRECPAVNFHRGLVLDILNYKPHLVYGSLT